jgi:hypothetical protein
MKTTCIKFISVIFAMAISLVVYSQENYVKGFIIKQNGDTLNGLVDYRNWSVNPKQVQFKKSVSDVAFDYRVIDIKAFGALDEIYKSAIVQVDNSNFIDGVSISPVFRFRTDTVFLQTLFQGTKSLYFYKDYNAQDNFYKFDNGQYELLEYKTYERKDNMGHEFNTENKRFVGQLRVYFQECPNIDAKLKDITYTNKGLENIYKYYYSQTKKETFMSRTSEKIRAEFGVIGGASMIDLSFITSSSTGTFDYLTKAKFENNLSLAGGLFMNIVFPRNNGKWSFYNELFFNSNVAHCFQNNYIHEEYYQKHTMDLGALYLKINNMFRFKYPVGKAFCFVNAGMSNGFVLIETNNDVVEDRYNNKTTFITQKVLDDTRKYEQGYLVGFGAIYKKYSVEFRVESASGMSPYIHLAEQARRYNLLFSYRF